MKSRNNEFAFDAVSVSDTLNSIGVHVVFQVSDIESVVCEFVPVRACVEANEVPFVTFITH